MRGDYAGQATTQEDPVLERFYVNPVLPAQNGDRARHVLGLELASGPRDDSMMFRAGGGEAVFTEQPGPACVDRSTSQTRSHHRALFSAAASTRSSMR
jgi:hypothetical protein